VAGGSGAGSATDELSFPSGLAVDSSGNLYVSDNGNDRVQEFRVADADLGISQPANIAVNATGLSGATVTYSTPTVSDGDDATAPAPSCLPASGSTFAVGSTTVECSVSDPDDTNGTQTTSFKVNVVGAGTQLANLLGSVVGVGPGTSYYDKLLQVQDDLAANDTADACSLLGAFVQEVKATQSQSAAAPLISSATHIGAIVGCVAVGNGLPSQRPVPGLGHSAR
jgi:hypothetical protein